MPRLISPKESEQLLQRGSGRDHELFPELANLRNLFIKKLKEGGYQQTEDMYLCQLMLLMEEQVARVNARKGLQPKSPPCVVEVSGVRMGIDDVERWMNKRRAERKAL
jgi:hypothetical protein